MPQTPDIRLYARVKPLDASTVTWAKGFWADRAEQTRTVTVPSIWGSLSNPAISPGWSNFQIASGVIDGTHQGPPFLDGDVYKWLEAAVSTLETNPDPQLEAHLDELIAVIVTLQRPDGYLHTETLINALRGADQDELADRFNFETYNLGHLITAGVRHFQATGRKDLLNVAIGAAGFLQNLADNDPDTLARSAICPSHYMAVLDLYRATGENQYLRLAERFLQVREGFKGGDDNQDRISIFEQSDIVGHSVRANYLYAGLADLAMETGDEELQAVLATLWQDAVDSKIYLTGGCGALYDGASPDAFPEQGEITRVHQAYGRPYQLPHTTAHNESCANIGMVLWSERMLALTGDSRYADLIETILYNCFLSSMSLDGTTYAYTNPLRQVRDLPFPLRMPGDTALSPVPAPPPSDARLRTEYLSVFCCPPNIARTIAQLHERVAGLSDDGVWIHQYASASIVAGNLALDIRTDYPWDQTVDVTVAAAPDTPRAIRLRIPAWCTDATISIDGDLQPAAPGYAFLERVWQAGQTIRLTLPMPVRILRGHRLAEELTNQVAIQRGPIVYCVESPDLGGVALEQVALRRDAALTPESFSIDGHSLISLVGTGIILPPAGDPDALYTEVPQGDLESLPLRLIPYFAWGNRGASEMSVWLPLAW